MTDDGAQAETQSAAPSDNKSAQARPARTRKSATAFRTISEVAEELDVQQHVLRFWETKFTQVKPLKRGGGRRYYRPEDVAVLQHIHHLLYTEGYTIKGAQKLLKGMGKSQIIEQEPLTAANQSENSGTATNTEAQRSESVQQPLQPVGMSDKQRVILKSMLGELKDLRDMLKGENS